MRRSGSTRSGPPGILSLLAGVITLNGVLARSAHAYIDPGTGSMLVQVMGAVVAGAIFYFRESLLRIKGFFPGRSKSGYSRDAGTSDDDAAP